jgi:RHS repeat-associated protein
VGVALMAVGLVLSMTVADVWAQGVGTEPGDSVPVTESSAVPVGSVSEELPSDTVPAVPIPVDVASTESGPVADESIETLEVPARQQVVLDGSGSPLSPEFPLSPPAPWRAGKPPVALRAAAGAASVGVGTDAAAAFVPPREVAVPATDTRVIDVGVVPKAAGSTSSVRVAEPGVGTVGAEAVDAVSVATLSPTDAQRVGLTPGAVRVESVGAAGDVLVEFDLAYLVSTSTVDVLDRVRLVALQPCALDAGAVASCAAPTVVKSEIDAEMGVLSAVVEAPASSGSGVLYGLSLMTGSSTTSYEASPLKASASWAVGEQSGAFSWSYPVPVVPSWFGPAPSVGLSYSSQGVDGLSDVENNQGGLLGLGWSVDAGGFIERSYRSCSIDGTSWSITDRCWVSDNATISLGGRSSRLVSISGSSPNQWRLEQDPNWVVRRLYGTSASPDNDGERWEVLSPDGMLYEFGAVPATTSSVWNVPVFGNNASDPCYVAGSSQASWCQQAWRWNLDRVTDTSGNTTVLRYVAQQNRYGRHGTPSQSTPYVSGGWLSSIEYGQRTGGVATGRVSFATGRRCFSNNQAGTGCLWFDASRSTPYWPDRPTDLVCTSGSYCEQTTPTFFIDDALAWVTSDVRTTSGGAWRRVHTIGLTLEWPDADGAGALQPQLWLRELQHTGHAPSGAALSMPPIRFESAEAFFDNRADAMFFPYWRIDQINDELGGRTGVTYFQPSGCATVNPSNPQYWTNTSDCFPQYTTVGGSAGFGYFNKYLVREVRQSDLTMAGSTPVVTTYDYFYGAAWHRNDDALLPNSQRTYSDYRGYSHIRTTRGAGADAIVNDSIYFRGMHGDIVPTGTRSVSVATTSGLIVDDAWRRGLLAEDRDIDLAQGTYVGYDYHAYNPVTTAAGGGFTAVRPDLTTVYSGVRQGAGWRDTMTQTLFNSDGFAFQVQEYGDVTTSADDRCTYTSYVAPTSRLRGLPNGQQTFATSACTGGYVAFTQTFYDGNTSVLDPPTRGIVTKQRTFTTASAYNDTSYVADSSGRIQQVIEPSGATTTTGFDSFSGYPATVTNHLGQTVTTAIEPGHGVTTSVGDANGKYSWMTYDPLGRLTSVQRHGESAATTLFEYSVTKTAPPWVKTTTVQSLAGGLTIPTIQYFDGLGRPRETQRKSPTLVGRIVTAIDYDNRGLATRTSDEFYNNASFASGVVTAAGFGTPPRETRTTFDRHGRMVRSALWAAGTEQWHTDTTYDGWLTTSIPPAGHLTQTETDGYGRTVKVRKYGNLTGWNTAVWDTLSSYTTRGEIASVTDANGNVTTTSYDFAGRATSTNDPNRGTTSYGYDANSNLTTVTTATGITETTFYDALNRPTSVWAGGFKRTEHFYDAPGERGLHDKSVAYEYAAPGITSYPYTIDVTGYDNRNRPTGTTYTIPVQPGMTDGLNGTYTYTQTYNDADQQTSLTYPSVADLAGNETVYSTYWTTGEARQTVGWEWYVNDTYYNYDGTRSDRVLGPPAPGGGPNPFQVVQHTDWQPTTGRLENITTSRRSGQLFQSDRIVYNQLGDIYGIGHDVDGTTNDHTECFGYDAHSRLVRAYTTSIVNNCAGGYNGAGPNPYNEFYTYDATTNITTSPAGSHTYNPSGPTSVRPNAPTQAGPTTYTYDNAGRRTTSTTSGVTSTYTWNVPGDDLVAIDRAGTRIQTNIYGPDNQRLIRKTATGTTLYLGGLSELTAQPANGIVTAKRHYQHDGDTIAVRSYTDVGLFATNHQASTVAVASTYTTNIQYQQYGPYGTKRGGDTLTTTQRGYIAQTEDDTTNLNYLNNRYYDTQTGVFLTVDPLVSTTGQPYTYANGNPTTLSDPNGLDPCLLCLVSQDGDGRSNQQRWADDQYTLNYLSKGLEPVYRSGPAGLARWNSEYQSLRMGNGWWNGLAKVGVVVAGVAATAACSVATAGLAAVGCAGAVGAATSWGLHALDGDYSLNAGDVIAGLVNGAAQGLPYLRSASGTRTATEAESGAMSQMERVGSGLKDDPLHRATSWVVDDPAAQRFTITGGDGVPRTLYQLPGEVNGKPGVFEWIVDSSGTDSVITHQRFIPGGQVTGLPNQP